MKKRLLSIMFIFFLSFHLAVFGQDVKNRVVVDTDAPVVEVIPMDSNRLLVKNAPIGKKLEIYSIVGTKVKVIEIKFSTNEYYLDLPKSIYIAKVGETVRKFVIK